MDILDAVEDEISPLNINDLKSATWKKLREYYSVRLNWLRRQNDAHLSPEETAVLRGSIAELKLFLSFDNEDDQRDFMKPGGLIG